MQYTVELTLAEARVLDGLVIGAIKITADAQDLYGGVIPSFPEWEAKLDHDMKLLSGIHNKLN